MSPMVFGMANTPIPAHDNPIMFGVNTHAHVPSHAQTAHFSYNSVPPTHQNQAPNNNNSWETAQHVTYVPVATEASHDSSQHHVKRERDGHDLMQEEQLPPADGMASPSSGKKQRPSNYRPPRSINKKSAVAVTGSLVGGGWEQSKTTVRMRRELSGGQLDQYFRDHDVMEDDDTHRQELRPRSMSF